jgi:cytochrome c oxidase assembly protein subunit 15
MTSSTDNSWLHRFAILTAAATFCLIWVGGLVTSHGAGMAVPDWPTTYGYNMFFFPISKWVGGVFYEHSHRLVASAVGLLTVVLAVWLWLKEQRRWLRWLGITALVLVVAQGILGGLRVTHMKDVLGVFHGTLAQIFFVLVSSIALFTSRWWRTADLEKLPVYDSRRFRYVFGIVTGLILLQLMLGAAMRHQHAGLAIPDFPLAYGGLWPDTDASAVARYNQARGDVTALNPITSFQVGLQMAHRIGAVLILISVGWVAGVVWRRSRAAVAVNRLSLLWLGLILTQASLGAATIWTNKAADIATAHVAVGALSLVTGAMLTLVASRGTVMAEATSPAQASRGVTEGRANPAYLNA